MYKTSACLSTEKKKEKGRWGREEKNSRELQMWGWKKGLYLAHLTYRQSLNVMFLKESNHYGHYVQIQVVLWWHKFIHTIWLYAHFPLYFSHCLSHLPFSFASSLFQTIAPTITRPLICLNAIFTILTLSQDQDDNQDQNNSGFKLTSHLVMSLSRRGQGNK